MTEVVAHDGQFGTVRERVGGVRVAHPVRTGLSQFLRTSRAVGLDQISQAMGQAGVAATAIRNHLAEQRPLRR